jgi:hypothetical protein
MTMRSARKPALYPVAAGAAGSMTTVRVFVEVRPAGLHPFRHRRMHRPRIVIEVPKSFVEQVLWPEFQELNAALVAYLSEITEKVIREEVHRETGEAEELDEPTRIGQ